MGGDEDAQRQLGYIGPVMTQRSHERLQGLIILAVQGRKPHIGPLSDSVTLLHIFTRNTPEQKREGPSET